MFNRIMTDMGTLGKDCQHHWVIEPADGPVSRGVCKLCHQVRAFENSAGGNKWGYFRLDTAKSGDKEP